MTGQWEVLQGVMAGMLLSAYFLCNLVLLLHQQMLPLKAEAGGLLQ